MLTFKNTVIMVLNMMKKSIAMEITSMFENYRDLPKEPSRQAFSKARDKISYLAIKELFGESCNLAKEDGEAKKFKGYLLLAIDGTSFFVGSLENKGIREYFGESTTVAGQAMARVSAVVDVLNNFITNAVVSAFEVGERALATSQIKELKGVKNALFLMDRGYWSPELVQEIDRNKQKFVMRLASNVRKTEVCDERGRKIPLRSITFNLPNETTEVLLTNLSIDEASDNDIFWIYGKRWGIETKYLELKDRLEIDSFSGQSANTVLQDIYATLYISNLIAFVCAESDAIIDEKTAEKENKYQQKANRSFCIKKLRDRFIDICLMRGSKRRAYELERLVRAVSNNVTYVAKSSPKPRDKRQMKAARTYPHKKSPL